jgi:hypothetical protein
VDPVPDPLIFRKPGSAEIGIRISGPVARTLTTRPQRRSGRHISILYFIYICILWLTSRDLYVTNAYSSYLNAQSMCKYGRQNVKQCIWSLLLLLCTTEHAVLPKCSELKKLWPPSLRHSRIRVDEGSWRRSANHVDAQMLPDGSRSDGNVILRGACLKAVWALLDSHSVHSVLLHAHIRTVVQPSEAAPSQPGTLYCVHHLSQECCIVNSTSARYVVLWASSEVGTLYCQQSLSYVCCIVNSISARYVVLCASLEPRMLYCEQHLS